MRVRQWLSRALEMNVQDLIDDPMVEKHIFLDFDGNIVCRFEHPEFIFEMTQEA